MLEQDHPCDAATSMSSTDDKHSVLPDTESAFRCVVGALMGKRPRTRYALVAQRFKNWTLPMWLPERWMDTLMAQAFLKK